MVSVVLDNLAHGKSADEIVQRYPMLQHEDVAAAIAYAAALARERDQDDGVVEALRRDGELDTHPEQAISFEQLDKFLRSRFRG